MRVRRRCVRLAAGGLAAALIVVASPAQASRFGPSGPPQYPSFPFELRVGSGGPSSFVQDEADPNKWVWTIDPAVYGATGTITFYDYQNAVAGTGTMRGPGGVGVNDWRVCTGLAVCEPGESPFRFDRPSFTQDVDSIPADFLTPDPPHDLQSDWDPFEYHPDGLEPGPFSNFIEDYPAANMDGSANLFKFAYTIAPGTQFMNMQVDRAGNYYVARRDMQWEWIDTFTYKTGDAPVRELSTQFNIQPYPISDAYGWCGAIPATDPSSLEPMAGQLIKDIAFDVYPVDGGPAAGAPPFATEVVPSFMMRSYGKYVVDVTMQSFGVHQHFEGTAKGVHIRPVDTPYGAAGTAVVPGDPDFDRWYNRVSPFAAGVVPIGAWVINEGTKYMQVVPAGTPGAVWHQNKFAGAAFLVRGDMERRVNYILAASDKAGDQNTVASYTEVYEDLRQAGEINPRTGEPWKRADWTDWLADGTLDDDAY